MRPATIGRHYLYIETNWFTLHYSGTVDWNIRHKPGDSLGMTFNDIVSDHKEMTLVDIFWHESTKVYSVLWDVWIEDIDKMERAVFTVSMAEEYVEMEPENRSTNEYREDYKEAGHVFIGQGIITKAIPVVDIERALHLGLGYEYVVTKNLPTRTF